MVSIKNAIKAMQEALELKGRAKALGVLRTMDRRWLEENGYSIEALEQGISAWPWLSTEGADRQVSAVTEMGCNPVVCQSESANDDEQKVAA